MSIVVFALIAGAIGLSLTGGKLVGLVAGAFMGMLAGWMSRLNDRVRQLEARVATTARDAAQASHAQPQPAAAARPPHEAAARPAPDSGARPAAGVAAAPHARVEPAGGVAPPAPAKPADERPPSARPESARPAAPTAAAAALSTAHDEATRAGAASPGGAPRATAAASQAPGSAAATAQAASQARAARRAALEQPTPGDPIDFVRRWLTSGNLPVKVGVVLSLFGVGFLVKEGIDRHWLVVPIEVRLALVALFGIALLALGWRLRKTHRSYALTVQGGGIAVLYLTIYSSFALFHLLPPVAAFALLLVVTVSAGALAVLQDARVLAVFGIVGGFMAPVLVSTGSNNHVALFGYYAILNLAILGVAWHKAWRELNVLGFLFTFGIGGLWGYTAYTPDVFATTEPFLVAFVLMYIAIPMLFASRAAPELRGFVDGMLVFGTPIVGFGLQTQLVDSEYGLAASALGLAALYVSTATFLLKRGGAELRVLSQAHFALSVAFLTVAIPLALDAHWTSAAWALQGAAMVWLGFRQRRRLALAAGVALQLLSAGAYVVRGATSFDDIAVLNGHLLGALLLAVAGGFSARLFEPAAAEPRGRTPDTARQSQNESTPASGGSAPSLALPLLAAVFLLWAGGWWIYAGLSEIDRFVPEPRELAAALLFMCATTVLAMLGAARFAWPRLNTLGLVLWPAAILGLLKALSELAQPAAGLGWVAWPAVIATMLAFLRAREARYDAFAPALHVIAYWLCGGLLAWETHWLVSRAAGGIWPAASALAVAGAWVLATLELRERVSWPLAAHLETYLKTGCGVALAAIASVTLGANLVSPGDAAPLPYVPLLNPLEIASVFVFLVLLRWRAVLDQDASKLVLAKRKRAVLAGLFAWFLLTMTVARAVHHWAGVPFTIDSLAASTVMQTALSIVWGATALAAMLAGARAGRRALWVAGATLMAVVVVKLFLVELGNSGTLTRIVSFLGVGLLLLVVGYFAPVPPRTELDRRAA
jgi:uncharacterized membrane protein